MTEATVLMDVIAGLRRQNTWDSITDILRVARRHLGMDTAFVSEFVDDKRIFRYVDPPDNPAALRIGASLPLDEGYCKRIVDGELPELIPDTAAQPAARALPITAALPIGAHVGVPVRLPDQQLYGTFCCFSGHADRSLNGRDLLVLRALADLVANQIERSRAAQRDREAVLGRIEAAIGGHGLSTVYQPIFALPASRIIGVECLARFTQPAGRSPDKWFADAQCVGLLAELEIATLRRALADLPRLPDHIHLAVNVSPSTILTDAFAALFEDLPAERIVVEVTEHADVPDYDALAACLTPLRQRKLRLAVDDAGAGFASLQHILNLRPDIIKLDMSLTRNVDADPARRSLASALVHFARDIGCQLVAEGVESDGELETLQALGVTKAQGYRLGRPVQLREVLRRIDLQGERAVIA